jgi:hypothetical protein
MIVPNPLAGKFVYFLGSVLFGGLIVGAVTSTGQTPLIGGAILLPEFYSNGTPSTARYAATEPFNAFLTATGGNVKVNGGVKYAAFCVPNPLTKLVPSQGSGAALYLSLDMGNNPSNASYDIDFVKSCNSGTGQTLLNNVLLGTGATFTLSGARLPIWNGADFLKGATTTVPNTATTGRFRGAVRDIYGE